MLSKQFSLNRYKKLPLYSLSLFHFRKSIIYIVHKYSRWKNTLCSMYKQNRSALWCTLKLVTTPLVAVATTLVPDASRIRTGLGPVLGRA